jgi:hypothetical protein
MKYLIYKLNGRARVSREDGRLDDLTGEHSSIEKAIALCVKAKLDRKIEDYDYYPCDREIPPKIKLSATSRHGGNHAGSTRLSASR